MKKLRWCEYFCLNYLSFWPVSYMNSMLFWGLKMKSQPVVDLSAILWGADLSESNSMELNQGHELCSKEKQFEAEKKTLKLKSRLGLLLPVSNLVSIYFVNFKSLFFFFFVSFKLFFRSKIIFLFKIFFLFFLASLFFLLNKLWVFHWY